MDKYNPEYIDKEERELIESLREFEPGEKDFPTEEEQKEIKKAAKDFMKKNTKMNIRIDPYELEKIKEEAAKSGLRYQTFVKSILHKYITGQLVEKNKKAG